MRVGKVSPPAAAWKSAESRLRSFSLEGFLYCRQYLTLPCLPCFARLLQPRLETLLSYLSSLVITLPVRAGPDGFRDLPIGARDYDTCRSETAATETACETGSNALFFPWLVPLW